MRCSSSILCAVSALFFTVTLLAQGFESLDEGCVVDYFLTTAWPDDYCDPDVIRLFNSTWAHDLKTHCTGISSMQDEDIQDNIQTLLDRVPDLSSHEKKHLEYALIRILLLPTKCLDLATGTNDGFRREFKNHLKTHLSVDDNGKMLSYGCAWPTAHSELINRWSDGVTPIPEGLAAELKTSIRKELKSSTQDQSTQITPEFAYKVYESVKEKPVVASYLASNKRAGDLVVKCVIHLQHAEVREEPVIRDLIASDRKILLDVLASKVDLDPQCNYGTDETSLGSLVQTVLTVEPRLAAYDLHSLKAAIKDIFSSLPAKSNIDNLQIEYTLIEHTMTDSKCRRVAIPVQQQDLEILRGKLNGVAQTRVSAGEPDTKLVLYGCSLRPALAVLRSIYTTDRVQKIPKQVHSEVKKHIKSKFTPPPNVSSLEVSAEDAEALYQAAKKLPKTLEYLQSDTNARALALKCNIVLMVRGLLTEAMQSQHETKLKGLIRKHAKFNSELDISCDYRHSPRRLEEFSIEVIMANPGLKKEDLSTVMRLSRRMFPSRLALTPHDVQILEFVLINILLSRSQCHRMASTRTESDMINLRTLFHKLLKDVLPTSIYERKRMLYSCKFPYYLTLLMWTFHGYTTWELPGPSVVNEIQETIIKSNKMYSSGDRAQPVQPRDVLDILELLRNRPHSAEFLTGNTEMKTALLKCAINQRLHPSSDVDLSETSITTRGTTVAPDNALPGEHSTLDHPQRENASSDTTTTAPNNAPRGEHSTDDQTSTTTQGIGAISDKDTTSESS